MNCSFCKRKIDYYIHRLWFLGKSSPYCSIQCKFLNRIDLITLENCWVYKRRNKGFANGYRGSMLFANATFSHRVAYYLFNKDYTIFGNLDFDVLHECDHKYCCNPIHLKKGNDEQNAHDRFFRRKCLINNNLFIATNSSFDEELEWLTNMRSYIKY